MINTQIRDTIILKVHYQKRVLQGALLSPYLVRNAVPIFGNIQNAIRYNYTSIISVQPT